MTLPAIPAHYSTGDTPTAAEVNAILDNLTFGVNPAQPGVLVTRTTYQTGVLTAVTTIITWQAATDDPLGMFSAGSPTQLVVKKAGLYVTGLQVPITAAAAGHRWGFCTQNTVNVANAYLSTGPSSNGADATLVNGATRQRFALNDVVRAYIDQNSGSTLQLQSDFGGTRMFMQWVGT
ncbi:MAG: hypothetical protein ACRDRO_21540 [Pseudonocardiaceae bacterium]